MGHTKNGQNPYLTLQGWLNGTLSDLTGYGPAELIFDSPTTELSEEFLEKWSEQKRPAESLQEKVLNVCFKMKERAAKGNREGGGESKWKLQVGDLVLCNSKAVSNAVGGVLQRNSSDLMMGLGKSRE
jgi:hypothetical protein